MDAMRTLVQRLRDKESRDNRALLDEAANAIEKLTEDKPCAWCRGEDAILDSPHEKVEILEFPAPHVRVTLGSETVGIAINYCPLCGRCLDGVVKA